MADRLDVIMQGTVFLDIVMTGYAGAADRRYRAGRRRAWVRAPGASRTSRWPPAGSGLRTGLAASFGDDVYGDFLWETLESQEGVDLSLSRRIDDWHSPVTVSLAVNRDRAMVTHAHESPIPDAEMIIDPPPAAAGVLHLTGAGAALGGHAPGPRARCCSATSAGTQRTAGRRTCCGRWPSWTRSCRTTSRRWPTPAPTTRALAMMKLADDVPLVVITCGGQGAIGLDASTAEEEWVPALPVTAVDPTGAGDVFLAAFVLGTLRGWPLRQRMAFANLCAGLSVQQVGGSLAAPGWGDLADWLAGVQARAKAGSRQAAVLDRSYGFLADVLPHGPTREVRRAGRDDRPGVRRRPPG